VSSKRNLRRRMCEGKRSYSTIKGAYAAQTGHAQCFCETLAVYFCSFCKRYHLGHPFLSERRTRQNFKEVT
jgi:hypothetical protein